METVSEKPDSQENGPVQLHLVLPYKFQPAEHPRIRGYLDRGWQIAELQRLTDREVLVTLAPPQG